MELTQENYYSHETDYHFLSFSLYKDFMKCEAAALAKLKEDWKPVSNPTPLLVGNYVHSTFESVQAHEEWLNRSEFGEKTNRELIMTKPTKKDPNGHLRAEFKLADEMISTLKDDDLFNFVYQPGAGEKEVIVTGKIDGVQWKGKIDSLNLDRGYFVDLKTVDDIHKKHWIEDESRWGNFIESRGYVMQMAIYKELIKQTFGVDCQPYMFAVSKQTPPDKMALDFQGDAIFQMEESLENIKQNQGRIQKIITGEEKPEHCGKCEYCRSTKKLNGFIHATDIDFD